MKKTNTRRGFTQCCFAKGFTLIELLVVVLIIGILAAVAVPQYQKAVVKSRFAEALTILKAIGEADQVCQANKGGPCNFDELDVEIGEPIDPMVRNSANFFYYPSAWGMMPNVSAYATYQKEDVCLCYMNNGEIWIKQNDLCLGDETSFDYAQLLGLPEKDAEGNSPCACC